MQVSLAMGGVMTQKQPTPKPEEKPRPNLLMGRPITNKLLWPKKPEAKQVH
jgi:hypothetical protein